MPIEVQPISSQLAKDASGKYVESVSVENWRPKRVNVTAAAWVDLSDGKRRSSIYIKNNGASNVVLAPASTGYSNDPTEDNCGISILPGQTIEPSFGSKLCMFARTEVGGGTCRLTVCEAF
jgi:hypothetical protein